MAACGPGRAGWTRPVGTGLQASRSAVARLEIYPVAAQSFQLYWSFLPEAADALDQVARFITPAQG
jgi:hypothetical protein